MTIETANEVARIMAMSDEEILADVRAQGLDPDEEADKCRAVIERAIAKASVLKGGDSEATARTTAIGKDRGPDAWRWRTLPQWIKHPDEAGWNYTDTEPKASDFMNPHHHEVQALAVVGSVPHLRTEPASPSQEADRG